MRRNVTAAPTKEMAIGRKMSDLATASPRRSRSAKVAKARPTVTATSGTTMIQPAVLRSARSMLSSLKTKP